MRKMCATQGRLRVHKTSHDTVPSTNLGLFRHGEVLDLPVPVVKDKSVVVPLLPEKIIFDYRTSIDTEANQKAI